MLWMLVGGASAVAGAIVLSLQGGLIAPVGAPEAAEVAMVADIAGGVELGSLSGSDAGPFDVVLPSWVGPEVARLGEPMTAAESAEVLSGSPEAAVAPTPGAVVLLGSGLAMAFRRPRGHAAPPAPTGATPVPA